MTSNQDKTNFLDLNNEPYKPVVRDFTFGLSVASLSNKKRSKVSSDPIDSATKIIELDPLVVSYQTFRTLFYGNDSEAFNINQSKKECFQMLFDQQTVSDSDGTHKFDLLDSILCAYEEEKKISRNLIPSKQMIKLTKEINEINSLYNICGCVTSLKWTEVLNLLKSNGLLSSFNENVCLKITFSYVNEKLLSKPFGVVFKYFVNDIYENFILARETEFKYYLDNSLFTNGTYRITRSGTYVLTENIIFNPNRYSDHKPREDQTEQYPKSEGYVLGFFAAITIETKNVVLDLNGFSISLHDDFNLRQRFCALIELASSPFIPKQGPANFGLTIKSAINVVIKNGLLGQVSHHGIHGNGCKNILIENLEFKNFEVAAISINGGEHITVNNCRVLHINRHINVLSTYSHAKFGLPKLKEIIKSSKEPLYLETHYDKIPLTVIQANIEKALNTFEKHIDMDFPVCDSIFFNETGLYDGNAYGIVFNSIGVVIGDFKPMRDDKTVGNNDIKILNTSIENIVSDGTEVASLHHIDNKNNEGYGKSAFVGVAGDVFNFLEAVDENGYYKGTIISDLQMAVCVHGNKNERGTGNIPEKLCKEWIQTKQNIMEFISFEEDDYGRLYGVNRDKDSMAHAMKGNIGLFISQGNNVIVDNVYIYNIRNKSNKQERSISTEAFGIAIVGSKNVHLADNIRIKKIKNPFGDGEHIKYINMDL
tara:strand:- start:604 stop:2730 length:2127 start_codon:yes stop_codon:yes gene_type:complete